MGTRAKIVSLQELAAVCAGHRAAGRRVVHCHGVFDLLHIGHIRYLQKARALGDVLVVTATPDRFVNKGPHRPAFPEKLRAEAIAALDCVDHVAINEWPTACETIAALRPAIYAKGAEFRQNRTPEILREEAAAAEAGTEIAFIEDITSSSSHLLNKHLSLYPEDVERYLAGMAQRHRPAEILRPVAGAQSLRVLVVGETIIDEYHYCQALGRSSKAPILAMQYVGQERFAGGAAAIANHLAGFCAEVSLVSMLGDQDDEEAWVRSQLRPAVAPHFLRKSGSPTLVKRRFRESYFAVPVFEVYVMNDAPLGPADNAVLCGRLREMAAGHDLVVVADFGHGMLSDDAIGVLCKEARFLTVNTQANAGNMGFHTVSRYPRADYVCLAEQEMRLECRSRVGDLRPMLEHVAAELQAGRVMVTRGGRGSVAYDRGAGYHEAPALATRVVDRVGAGDAVLAVTSLCAAQGTPLEIQAFLGNVAGAEAAATVGNRDPLEKLALMRHVESLLK